MESWKAFFSQAGLINQVEPMIQQLLAQGLTVDLANSLSEDHLKGLSWFFGRRPAFQGVRTPEGKFRVKSTGQRLRSYLGVGIGGVQDQALKR